MEDPVDFGPLIDGEFGAGVFERVSRAAVDDVEQKLAVGNLVEAAFSAAHFCVLAGRVGWSEDTHDRMVDALKSAASVEVQAGRSNLAVWRGAYLRMLTQQVAELDHQAVSAQRQELDDRLASGDSSVVCAGMCVDVWLLTGEWAAPADVSRELVDAVRVDVEHRLRYTDNDAMTADRVTLWLLATSAARSRFGDGGQLR